MFCILFRRRPLFPRGYGGNVVKLTIVEKQFAPRFGERPEETTEFLAG
jgi:hypothetical protein